MLTLCICFDPICKDRSHLLFEAIHQRQSQLLASKPTTSNDGAENAPVSFSVPQKLVLAMQLYVGAGIKTNCWHQSWLTGLSNDPIYNHLNEMYVVFLPLDNDSNQLNNSLPKKLVYGLGKKSRVQCTCSFSGSQALPPLLHSQTATSVLQSLNTSSLLFQDQLTALHVHYYYSIEYTSLMSAYSNYMYVQIVA